MSQVVNEDIDHVLEGLDEVELRDTIVRNVRFIQKLKADGKAYSKSIREQVKALEERNKYALELIDQKAV